MKKEWHRRFVRFCCLEKYEVDHCADGLSGLEAIETDIYDIIILDVMLPKMNGFEIAKKVRKNGVKNTDFNAHRKSRT